MEEKPQIALTELQEIITQKKSVGGG
jgi:hypothetical protein